jgi:hypothetical protein
VLVLSWGIVAYFLKAVGPDSYISIFSFVTALFIAFSFTLSIPSFLYLKRKKPVFLSENLLYRKSLKYGFYIAFGIYGVALLKAFKIVSLLNLGLFMLLYLGIFYQLKSKR